jgi:hypothetical protein
VVRKKRRLIVHGTRVEPCGRRDAPAPAVGQFYSRLLKCKIIRPTMDAHIPRENTIACLTEEAVIISQIDPIKATIKSSVCSIA